MSLRKENVKKRKKNVKKSLCLRKVEAKRLVLRLYQLTVLNNGLYK